MSAFHGSGLTGPASLGASHAEAARFATLSHTPDQADPPADPYPAQVQALHRRIRDDLQGLHGLAAFHARRADGIASEAGFEALCRRTTALAALYDELLRNNGAENVDFASYLAGLCGRLAAAEGPAGIRLTLHIEGGPIEDGHIGGAVPGPGGPSMPGHIASALGAVVAELVAALGEDAAHFAGSRVLVQLVPAGADGRGRLTVSASGMPDDVDTKQSYKGHDARWVRNLVAEAGGELDRFVSCTGAGWCVRF